MNKKFFIGAGVITLAAIGLVFMVSKALVPQKKAHEWKSFSATVTKVYDGDTVKLLSGVKVRLLGIDAPEIHHPDVPVQKYGYESYHYLKRRILGKTCKIEYNTGEKYDKYGRLLAYIYLDGVFLNGELVEKGLAYIYNRSERKKSDELRRLEQKARGDNKGIWKK